VGVAASAGMQNRGIDFSVRIVRIPRVERLDRAGSRLGVPLANPRTHRDHFRPRLHGLWGRIHAGPLGGHPVEVALEAGGRADDQDTRLGTAQVGEGVGNATRGEGQLSLRSREDLVLELEGEFPLQDVERLVEIVAVQGRPREAGADYVVHDGYVPPALPAAQ
jgi:hypothetical protein